MQRLSLKPSQLVPVFGLLFSVAAHADSDVLWRIVHNQCVPNLKQTGATAPCDRIELGQGEEHGFTVLKDRKGVLQYLLIPTAKVTGIESPALLAADAPDYWGEAWTARSFMNQKRGSDVPREAVSLAINSVKGRSQNQLHIHISCVRADVRDLLAAKQGAIGNRWGVLPGGLSGHPYQVRRIDGSELAGVDPFRLLAADLPGAREKMGDYTMAVVASRFADGKDGFYVLAGKTDLAAGIEGAAEDDVQDHDCRVLK